MLSAFILVVIAYLFGSLSSAILIARMMRLPDPRTVGSQNPGATNMLRIGGKKLALMTLIGDLLKGLIPVLLAKWVDASVVTIAIVGLAAFLGHLYPIFFGFSGGKGVATAAGVIAGISFPAFLLALFVWLLVAFISRYSSLAAMLSATAIPLLLFMLSQPVAYIIMTLMMAMLLIYRHRENIDRIRNREESQLKLGKRSD